MVNQDADVLFGDFGAATNLAMLSEYQRQQMQLIEVRALGCLIDDLLSVCSDNNAIAVKLAQLAKQCMTTDIIQRPTLSQLSTQLTTQL